jgi:hypothetical protein
VKAQACKIILNGSNIVYIFLHCRKGVKVLVLLLFSMRNLLTERKYNVFAEIKATFHRFSLAEVNVTFCRVLAKYSNTLIVRFIEGIHESLYLESRGSDILLTRDKRKVLLDEQKGIFKLFI